jgi:hypothetical protein
MTAMEPSMASCSIDFIIPAVETSAPVADAKITLRSALTDIWANKSAIGQNTEARMLPSAALKERR